MKLRTVFILWMVLLINAPVEAKGDSFTYHQGHHSAHSKRLLRSRKKITYPLATHLDDGYYSINVDPCYRRRARLTAAIAGLSATYGAVGVWCYLAWYKDQEHSRFRFVNEGWFGQDTYAGGTDKLGHAWSNYVMVRATAGILQWGGIEPRYAQIIASTLTMLYFTGVEIKDGYGMERSHQDIAANYDYGFSWEDLIADIAGNVLALAFITWPTLDDMLDYRLEYFPSPEYLRLLKNGDPNAGEDYSGMYYGLWYHLASIPQIKCAYQTPLALFKYIDIGVGYHTHGFMPKTDSQPRRQLYFGVALNMQQLLDTLFFAGRCDRCVARNITRSINEVITLPGTALHFSHTLDNP